MKNNRKEVLNEIDNLLNKSKTDLQEIDMILKKIKKDAFSEYRRRFKQNEKEYMN